MRRFRLHPTIQVFVICATIALLSARVNAAAGATFSYNETSVVGRWVDARSVSNSLSSPLPLPLSGVDFVVTADPFSEDVTVELTDINTQSIVHRLQVTDRTRIQLQWYDVSASFDLSVNSESDAVDSEDAEGIAVAMSHYHHAANQFCTGAHGRAVIAASDSIFRSAGLTGVEHRAALALHIVAQRCLHSIQIAAKRSGVEMSDAMNSISMGGTCPAWPNGNGQTETCRSRGVLLSAPQCKDSCLGSCGPSCTCWQAMCGDCCAHPGCEQHDAYCRSGGATNFAKCYAGYGCLIGAPATGCC